MDEKRLQHWESTRKRGILRFVLLYGFVNFTLAALFMAIMFWLAFSQLDLQDLWEFWGLKLAALPACGVLLTAFGWFLNERHYAKATVARQKEGDATRLGL